MSRAGEATYASGAAPRSRARPTHSLLEPCDTDCASTSGSSEAWRETGEERSTACETLSCRGLAGNAVSATSSSDCVEPTLGGWYSTCESSCGAVAVSVGASEFVGEGDGGKGNRQRQQRGVRERGYVRVCVGGICGGRECGLQQRKVVLELCRGLRQRSRRCACEVCLHSAAQRADRRVVTAAAREVRVEAGGADSFAGRLGGAGALGALGDVVVATGATVTDTGSDLDMAGTGCSRDGGQSTLVQEALA